MYGALQAQRKSLKQDHPRSLAAAVMQVRAALASKVSRERVGTELDGMMNGEPHCQLFCKPFMTYSE